ILDDEFIIDLRAGFYLKFYTLKIPHITLKFYKGDKVVSHWAKAYRGKVVKALAKHQPQNEVAFQKIEFDNLQIREIIKRKQSSEYIFDII
ncbi:MAG: YaaA family protein, partial [Epsilonproteobacteria bacterium]|nr:YaaA family protein [Campylobacterota bacterium]